MWWLLGLLGVRFYLIRARNGSEVAAQDLARTLNRGLYVFVIVTVLFWLYLFAQGSQ